MFLLALAAVSTRVAVANARFNTVFELRDYLLRPGQRDVLIELFERELVESQEAFGATIVGTFRTIDVPERFVWIRSFVDMDARRRALAEIYSGPAWLAHRGAANATIVDSSNVYLLHPIGHLPPPNLRRLPLGSKERHRSMFVVDLYTQGTETEVAFRANAAHGQQVIATFATERTANDVSAAPVRSDNVLVALRRFDALAGYRPIVTLPVPSRTLRLQPTSRSLLR